MSNQIFKGVWPALFTPVHASGQLNEKELEKLVELLIGQGMDGIYLLGSTGQGLLFSEEERKAIAAATLEIVAGRVPVMVQVGALNTEESIRLAKHAAGIGADGISSVGPIYFGSGTAMAFQHYRRIAEATDLPFFPYQIGAAADMQLIDLLLDIPQVQGMKLTTGKLLEISSIKNRSGNRLRLFSGADELMCQSAICGTIGAIGTFYNMFGPTCKHIRASFLEGEVKQAEAFMLSFQAFIEKVLPFVWTFLDRGMFLKYGIRIGAPKPPLLAPATTMTDQEIIDLMNEVEKFSGITV